MSSHIGRGAAILLGVTLIACAKHDGAGPPAPRDLNIITREQLVANHFTTAYDAVVALRSNWLQKRGTDSFRSPSRILVYFDDVKLGGIETLRTVPTTSIEYVRHYDGIDATTRWGLDHGSGVIFISTRLSNPF
jgi:hypothetical protein